MEQRQNTWCAPELDRNKSTLDLLRREHTVDTLSTSQAWEGGFDDYLLIFSRSSGTDRVRYMVLNPPSGEPHCRPLPKISTVLMSKVKDIIGYRVVVLDNYLYVLGGKHYQTGSYLKYCHRFDPRNNQWLPVARMSRARTRFTATAMDGYIYVCGGETRGGRATDSVECYDPLTDTWTNMRPLPAPRADHAACVASGRLFVSGGVEDARTPTNTFWQYEPLSDFWSQGYDNSLMPRGRQRHLMVEHKGKVYCMGGIATVRKNQAYVDIEDNSVTSFDCSKGNIDTKITGEWNQGLPPMRTPRTMAGTIVLGHNIFVIGGYNYTKAEAAVTMEYYNIRRQRWMESFPLGSGDFTNVECCLLRVPKTNRGFSYMGLAMTHKWVLW